MSMPGLFWRFALVYLVLLLGLGLVVTLLGVSNSGVGTAALLATVMWVCMSFGKKNGRYFTREEKRRVMFGMLAIDVVIQLVFSVAATRSLALSAGVIALGLLFVAVLHGAVIYIFVGLAGRRQVAAATAAAGKAATAANSER